VAIALNIAALVLVIGISWAGVLWLGSFFHRGQDDDKASATKEG
jgi:hypothetical protein